MLKKIVKLLGINILIFIGLLLTINIIVILIYQTGVLINKIKGKEAVTNIVNDQRYKLPNYKNIDWAQEHFKEIQLNHGDYKSYIGWRRFPFESKTINIDENRLRYTPQSPLSTDESPLVVFLGGSTMFGQGAKDALTIPAKFAEIANGEYRTMNLAESGWRPFQSYIFLLMQLQNGLKPDVIITLDGVNERTGYIKGIQETSHKRELQIRHVMYGHDRKDWVAQNLSFKNFFLSPLLTFITKQKIKYGFQKKFNIEYDHTSNRQFTITTERTQNTARALLDSWLLLQNLATQIDATFICALQPNTAIGNPQISHLKINEIEMEPYVHLYPAILGNIHNEEYKALLEHFIDLSTVFDGDDYFFIDYCHVSPNGNRVIAEALYAQLKQKKTTKNEK